MTEYQNKLLINLRYAGNSGIFKEGGDYTLDAGSLDFRDDNGASPLSYAVYAPGPKSELLTLLLSYKPALNIADIKCLQLTPLMHAVMDGDNFTVISLLKAGANPDRKDILGLMAYDHVILLLKNDDELSAYTKRYPGLLNNYDENNSSLFDWLPKSARTFPYSKYYQHLSANSAQECLICQHFKQEPNGDLFIDTGIPGVRAYNRIAYQLFDETFNRTEEPSWRMYCNDIFCTCPVCKTRYHYRRVWDDEWGSFIYEESFKRV